MCARQKSKDKPQRLAVQCGNFELQCFLPLMTYYWGYTDGYQTCFSMRFTVYPCSALCCVLSMLRQVCQSELSRMHWCLLCVPFSPENRHTHQESLVFTVTGRPSAERLSLAELSHCLRQWSGIFTNRLRHRAICAGHLLLALLLIYVLLSRQKSKASHPRLHTLSHAPPQVNKWTD